MKIKLTMETRNKIRYGAFSFGVVIMLFVLVFGTREFFSYKNTTELIAGIPTLVIVFLWNIIPHIIYLIVSRKIHSIYALLTSAIFLCSFELYSICTNFFFTSHSSKGLIFIGLPVSVGIVMFVGLWFGFLVERIKMRDLW